VVLTAAEAAAVERPAGDASDTTSAGRAAAGVGVAATSGPPVGAATGAAAAGGGGHDQPRRGEPGATGGAADGDGPGDGSTDTALELDEAPRARGSSRARLVGAGALGGLALLAAIIVFAILPAGGGDNGDEVRTEESTTTTVGVEVLADSLTQADAALAEAQASTTELQTAEQAAAALDGQIGAVSSLTVASWDVAGQKQRTDLQGQAQALAARIDAVKPQAAQAVSDAAALKLRAAAAVAAAGTAKADLDKAVADGGGDTVELQAAVKKAKDETAVLVIEVQALNKRVGDLTAVVAGLAQEVGNFKTSIDGIPAPTTPPPATAPPATAPPATAPPATVPALAVSISGPGCVPVGGTSYFTGYSATGVSGQWSLPAFDLNDASWTPGSPTQYVSPQAVGDFQWQLVVQDAHGQTATASLAFSTRLAC
jgi:hypothetical protein